MSKIANLQSALNSSSGRTAPLPIADRPISPPPTKPEAARQPGRAEQANISAWLHKDFKKSIRLIQAKKTEKATLQDLMAEAFNDLFSKYNVPTVNEE
jgi:hypothetical protein